MRRAPFDDRGVVGGGVECPQCSCGVCFLSWSPVSRSIVYLEIDNRLGCLQEVCFRKAGDAADYLGALFSREMLDFPYPMALVGSKDPPLIMTQTTFTFTFRAFGIF